ncbi:MAG: hypothetical protein L7F77_11250 [Candidatus Magnetominusculus sp. LBB02]|nr:hypothetical protein [Candidatus Magnetominusculus sp. LBB02]
MTNTALWVAQTISRRSFMAGGLAALGTLLAARPLGLAAQAEALPPDVTDTHIKSLTYKIEYLTEFYTVSEAKEAVRMWIPLPVKDAEQEVSHLSIEAAYPYSVNRASDNSFVYIENDGIKKKGPCASVRYTIKRKAAAVENALEGGLKLSEWERPDEAITQYVDKLTGNEKDPVRIARVLYDDIISRTQYTHEACSRGVSALAFDDKSGRSDDFHAMFRTMMALKKIPVKWEQGIMLPYRPALNKKGKIEADCINSHSWLKFYAGGKSIPVDLSEAKRWPVLKDFYFGRLTPNRIKFSTGRGLMLNPPQSEILNTFSYTHAEGDGVVMVYGHNYRTFIKYELVAKEA